MFEISIEELWYAHTAHFPQCFHIKLLQNSHAYKNLILTRTSKYWKIYKVPVSNHWLVISKCVMVCVSSYTFSYCCCSSGSDLLSNHSWTSCSGVLPSLSFMSALAPTQSTLCTSQHGKFHGTCMYDNRVMCYAVHVYLFHLAWPTYVPGGIYLYCLEFLFCM